MIREARHHLAPAVVLPLGAAWQLIIVEKLIDLQNRISRWPHRRSRIA